MPCRLHSTNPLSTSFRALGSTGRARWLPQCLSFHSPHSSIYISTSHFLTKSFTAFACRIMVVCFPALCGRSQSNCTCGFPRAAICCPLPTCLLGLYGRVMSCGFYGFSRASTPTLGTVHMRERTLSTYLRYRRTATCVARSN